MSVRDIEARMRGRQIEERVPAQNDRPLDSLWTAPPSANFRRRIGATDFVLSMIPVELAHPFNLKELYLYTTLGGGESGGLAFYRAISPQLPTGTALRFQRLPQVPITVTTSAAGFLHAVLPQTLLLDPGVWYYVGVMTNAAAAGFGFQCAEPAALLPYPTCARRSSAYDFPEEGMADGGQLGTRPAILLCSDRFSFRMIGMGGS